MKMAYRKIIIGAIIFSMTLGPAGMQSVFAGNTPGSSRSDYQARLRQLIESGDVRYDETARNGVVVDLVNNPEEYDAGVLLTGIMIVVGVVSLVHGAVNLYHSFVVEDDKLLGGAQTAALISEALITVAGGKLYFVADGIEITVAAYNEMMIELYNDPQAFAKKAAVYPAYSVFGKYIAKATANHIVHQVKEVYPEVAKDIWDKLASSIEVDMAGNYVFLTPHDEMYYGTMDYSRLDLDVVSKGLIKDMELSLALDEWGNVVVLNTEMVKGGSLVAAYDLDHWEAKGALAGLSSFGPIQAPNSDAGSHFGLIHTGLGDASAEGHLDQTFISPRTSAATFAVRYNFVTTEFPEWLASVYNDSFFIELVHVQTGATKVLAKFEGSLNQIFSENDINSWKHVQFSGGLPFQILDMADTGAGQTGWITTSKGNLNLSQGSLYKVQIRVNDVTDEIWDSALLIDKVSLR